LKSQTLRRNAIPAPKPPPSGVSQAELDTADNIGRLMEFWGFKRPMGRMWTLLYLSAEPLGAAELGERLRMSAGAVSMTLSELVKWGAVRKTWRPGERRDFYEAETEIWKLVRRVLRERELTLVHEVGDALQTAINDLPTAGDASSEPFKRERLEQLLSLAKIGEQLLGALVAGHAIDPTPLRDIARGRS
jgi:DNA-binding transcriptional regulator GbsR (MarR family)